MFTHNGSLRAAALMESMISFLSFFFYNALYIKCVNSTNKVCTLLVEIWIKDVRFKGPNDNIKFDND